MNKFLFLILVMLVVCGSLYAQTYEAPDGGYAFANCEPDTADIFVVVMELYQWVKADVEDGVYYWDEQDNSYCKPNSMVFIGGVNTYFKFEFIGIYKKGFACSIEASKGLAKIWDEMAKQVNGYFIPTGENPHEGIVYSKTALWNTRPKTIHKIFVYELLAETGKCNKRQLIPEVKGWWGIN